MGRPGPSPSDRKGAGVLWEVGAVSPLQLLAGGSLPVHDRFLRCLQDRELEAGTLQLA